MMYNGRIVTNIKPKEIILNNGRRIPVGEYNLTHYEIPQMLRETIRPHSERETGMVRDGHQDTVTVLHTRHQ